MKGTIRSRYPWLRGVIEAGVLLGVLLLSFMGVVLAGILQKPWIEKLSFFLIPGLLLLLLFRGVVTLWQSRLSGILRLLALPVVFVGGFGGIFVASMIGDSLPELWEQYWRTLPIEKGAERSVIKEGKRIASLLSAKSPDGMPMELRQVMFGLEFKGAEPTRTIGFDFAKGAPEFFSCSSYRLQGDRWIKVGEHSSGGELKSFEANRKAILPALPKELQGNLEWPLKQAVAEQFIKEGREIANLLERQQPLATEGAAWSLEGIHFGHGIRKGWHDSIEIKLQARREKERVAWASVYLTYDGKMARLDRCIGGGGGSDGSMIQEAALMTIFREWLSEDRGILKKAEDHGKPWRSCEATLPGGIRMIYHEQPAHAFLAEYNMRMEFLLPDGRHRKFDLPMNTGGRTRVLVYEGSTADGGRAIRLVSGAYINAAFDLGTLRMIDPKAVLNESYEGVFLEEKTPLTWFPSAR